MNIGIYPGTFDPLTFGHLDIIKRGLNLCDKLVIAIGVGPGKKPFFSERERLALINKSLDEVFDAATREHIEVASFHNLLVEFAKEKKARFLLRGIRSVSDFEYEINLANVFKTLDPLIETIFLPTNQEFAVVSSSMAKEIAKYGGDVSKFVPKSVAKAINEKFGFIKFSEEMSKGDLG